MKYYAAIGSEVPQHILVRVMGAVDSEDGVFYTQPFESKNHLITLIGTVQSRMEREGREFDGGCILPYGAKLPTKRRKFKVSGPLKARTDYGAFPEPSQVLEMRSPYNKFYAAQEDFPSRHTLVVPPNEYYDDGLTVEDIEYHNSLYAKEIVNQLGKADWNGALISRAGKDVFIKQRASREQMFGAFDAIRATEYHFASGKNTKQLWVDINPTGELPWLIAKRIAADMLREMSDLDEAMVLGTELKFSGDAGFHVIAHIASPMSIDDARLVAEHAVARYAGRMNDSRINANTLDCSSMREGGGLRLSHSICRTSGLVCLPVDPATLGSFDRVEAAIKKRLPTAQKAPSSTKPTYEQSMQKTLGWDDERMARFRQEVAQMTPADVKEITEGIEECAGIDLSVELDELHQDVVEGIMFTGEVMASLSVSLGAFGELYKNSQKHLGPIVQKVQSLETLDEEAKRKIAHNETIRMALLKRLRGGRYKPLSILRQHVEQRTIQNKEALAKLKEMLARTKGLNRRGGYAAEYRRLKARGYSTEKLVQNALTLVDMVIDVFGSAVSFVHKTTVLPFRKESADEAVMEYPAVSDTEEAVDLDATVDQMISYMTQANTDLDSAGAILEDMWNEAQNMAMAEDFEEQPIEAQAGDLEDDMKALEPAMRHFRISVPEMDALTKWLNVRKGQMSIADVDAVLAVKERLGWPTFAELVAATLGWIAPPESLPSWIEGLEMLKELPKYQSSQNMSIQDFNKQHNFVPWSPGITDLADRLTTPLTGSLPPKAIEGIVDMQAKLDPVAFQRYVEIVLGMVVPLQHLDTLVERLKDMHSLRPRVESSENPMFAWEFLDLQEKYGIVKARKESQNGGQDA